MTSYGNHHRTFLQAIMINKICNAVEVKDLVKRCCRENDVPINVEEGSDIIEFIKAINNRIEPFHMRIRKGVSEETGMNYYALVCTTEGAIARFASDYTKNELEYFKKLIQAILESEEGCVSSVEALNLTNTLDRKISKKDAEDLLERMIRDSWISVDEGDVSLTTRSIIELEPYIKDVYAEIITMCQMCNEICIKGLTCESCNARLHYHCTKRLAQSSKNVTKCPQCKNELALPSRITHHRTVGVESKQGMLR